MNKNLMKLIPILLSVALATGCKPATRPSSNSNTSGTTQEDPSSGYNYEDNSDNGSVLSSDIPVSSSSIIDDGEQGDLDAVIAQFVNGLNITVPSVNEYDMYYEVSYYYAYQQYFISAMVEDTDSFESGYLAKFTSETGLVSLNDETYYTVEDYGYMFGDDADSPELTVTFYTEEGMFYLTVSRENGHGTLDVSDIDTSWYVDYVNFNGFGLNETFPEVDINVSLETDLTIPGLTASAYPYYYSDAYEDETGSYPATYYVLFEGDKLSAYKSALETAGYEVTLKEETTEEFDLEQLDYVETTYQVLIAFDTDHTLYIYAYLDSYQNTLVCFYKYSDVVSDALTTNTDWTDEEKALMNSVLGAEIPFMQFGADYEIYDDSDEEFNVLVLIDAYYEDLTDEYIALLLEKGYKKDSTSYSYTCYYYDNGEAYIEIFPDYDGGNYFEIYSEPSKLPAITNFSLNKSAVDIVAGGYYQLEAAFTPANSAREIAWTVSSDIATVNNGLVEISDDAQVGQTVTVTAKTVVGNVSASCVFTIVSDSVTAIEYEQANYFIAAGGAKIQPSWRSLPYGATLLAVVTFSLTGASAEDGIYYDQDGYLWATSDAVVGKTFTINVTINGSITASATVTVVEATVTHTLNQSFFGLKAGTSSYATYTKTTADGATYEAQCAATHGVQIRSKNSDSGIIGHFEGRTCKSITFNIESNTFAPRTINIYGSNTPFSIEDMYDMSEIASVTYTSTSGSTLPYTFTEQYSYIGFRTADNAVYLDSIVIVWEQIEKRLKRFSFCLIKKFSN